MIQANQTKQIGQLLISSLDPSLLQRDVFWFEEHAEKIIHAAKTDQFWRHNALIVNTHQKITLSDLLLRIDELGYEKKYSVFYPGTYAHRGGIIEIFPINHSSSFLIEMFGNNIEEIILQPLKISEKERSSFLTRKAKKENDLITHLKEGEYITHIDHGIGQYIGQITKESITKSDTPDDRYIVMHYAPAKPGGMPDKLFVPLRQIKKISRYLGFITPSLHRLGSQTWRTTTRKAKENAIKLAKELLELYAMRHKTTRTAYNIETDWEKTIESSFPFQETEDQLRALEDIKKDLQSTKPMDRLVVGEVGFGKTEVALRAAVIAASNGMQVAILAPTTILADQHYYNFKKRIESLPIEIGLLSRFEKKYEQKKTIQKLSSGSIDIIIGTHRLLGKDIIFKKLGLLIIDEEQKFGVKQKEKIKAYKNQVDILSLSATPIPRTLYLALSNLRDISEINSAPSGRQAIETKIIPWNEEDAKKALQKELERNPKGQIYWLHNRIETIEKMREIVSRLAPHAKIAVAHGRMNEQSLRKILQEFKDHKKDILLSTTIIENGLDLPKVNTLIVDDASRLGLAQAHQLRGRVGRSHEKAFAYFFHPKHMSQQAQLRLAALEQYSYLGAGLEIAKKDLEIRGAGNVLGREQSGAINQVGMNLYCQMLSDAVEEFRMQEQSTFTAV